MLLYIEIGIIIVLVLVLIRHVGDQNYLVTTIDTTTYPVLGRFEDRISAAERLSKINRDNVRLIDYMIDKYPNPQQKGYQLAHRLKRRYCTKCIRENDPPNADNTSYTEDKGKVLALCLREKRTGKNLLHDSNIIMFVNIHELAHISAIDYGHEDEFWSNFKFLLNDAVEAGLYQPVDYSQQPINYCGLDVTYNPLYDKELSA